MFKVFELHQSDNPPSEVGRFRTEILARAFLTGAREYRTLVLISPEGVALESTDPRCESCECEDDE